jgi:hypothetical protein
LRGAQPSTPSRTAHSTRSALEREFNPAIADCGLQGTATSPSSTAKASVGDRQSLRRSKHQHIKHRTREDGGGGGIRTHGTVARTRHFQCRTFGHSATPPLRPPNGQPALTQNRKFAIPRIWRRGEDLNPRGTCAPIRFRVGRLQPGSATPPRNLFNMLHAYWRSARLPHGKPVRQECQVTPSRRAPSIPFARSMADRLDQLRIACVQRTRGAVRRSPPLSPDP